MSALVSNIPPLASVPAARSAVAEPVAGNDAVAPATSAEEQAARAHLLAQLDDETPDPHRIFAALNDFTLHFYRRKPDAARNLLELTILLGERWFGGQVRAVAIAHLNAATIALDSNDHASCARHAAIAEPALDALGETVHAAHAAEMLGSVAFLRRRFLEAASCLGRALSRIEAQFGTGHQKAGVLAVRLARAHAATGDALALILLEARYGNLRG